MAKFLQSSHQSYVVRNIAIMSILSCYECQKQNLIKEAMIRHWTVLVLMDQESGVSSDRRDDRLEGL